MMEVVAYLGRSKYLAVPDAWAALSISHRQLGFLKDQRIHTPTKVLVV